MDKKDININFDDFEKILDYFKSKNYQFVNEKLKQDINNSVKILFPNINQPDSQVLYLFTENIIEKISLYFNFKIGDSRFYSQWTQNNYRDIKGVILLLLPFIDDKNNGKLLNEMIDLNQFLYSKIKGNIPDLSILDRNDLLKNEFKFSNMSIGMLQESGTNMLSLYESDGKMKLIYKIIHHNYLGLLKTLEVMNGKYYVNWTNIVPILLDTKTNKNIYKNSELYKKTILGLTKVKTELKNSNETLIDFFNNYYGLYLGDFYNVIKTKLYDEIKHIKWMIYTTGKNIYNIQFLKNQISLNSLFIFNNYEDINSSDKFTFEKDIQKQISLIKIDSNISKLWCDILIFLANDYSKKFIVKNDISIFNKFSFETTINQFDFSDDDKNEEYSQTISQKISQISPNDIYQFLSEINPKHIWNFLYESIKKLENTYLRDYLIVNNSISDIYYFPGKSNINFKNIYNIAKSITHYEQGSEWLSYDSHFISFTLDTQKNFLINF